MNPVAVLRAATVVPVRVVVNGCRRSRAVGQLRPDRLCCVELLFSTYASTGCCRCAFRSFGRVRERGRDAPMRPGFDAEFVVAAAKVLHHTHHPSGVVAI